MSPRARRSLRLDLGSRIPIIEPLANIEPLSGDSPPAALITPRVSKYDSLQEISTRRAAAAARHVLAAAARDRDALAAAWPPRGDPPIDSTVICPIIKARRAADTVRSGGV